MSRFAYIDGSPPFSETRPERHVWGLDESADRRELGHIHELVDNVQEPEHGLQVKANRGRR